MDIERGCIRGVHTTRGHIGANKVGIVVAGNTSRVAAMAGLRLPIETHVLQAMVSEPLKPIVHQVVSSDVSEVYVSQTDKGELLIGSVLDFYPSYAQRGNLPRIERMARPSQLRRRFPGCHLTRQFQLRVRPSETSRPVGSYWLARGRNNALEEASVTVF